MKISRLAIVLSGFVLFGALVAWAQEELMANQGTPGTRGAWPVSLTSASSVTAIQGLSRDGGVNWPVETTAHQCDPASPHAVTSVTTASTTTPATAYTGRTWTEVCNSPQNTANTIVKCRADGTAPVFAAGNAGSVLEVGDCVTFSVNSSRNILCISNVAGGADVQTYQCY